MRLLSSYSLIQTLVRTSCTTSTVFRNIRKSRIIFPIILRCSLSTHHGECLCWKCQSNNNKELFCPHCQIIQKLDDMNYFQLLKTEQKYNIKLGDVKRYYIKLQSLLHPDKFATASSTEQDYSSMSSTLVNEAYKTLSDPIKRGLYLLEINGHELDSETVVGDDKSILNDIFMLNFEVEEAEDADELKEILEGVDGNICAQIDFADNAFIEKDFLHAKQAIIKLKYYYNIKTTIEDKLLDLSLL